MIRIILGVLIALGFLVSLAKPVPVFTEQAEFMGFIAGKIVLIILIIWLIYSGARSKKRLANEQKEKKNKMELFMFFKTFFGRYSDFLKNHILKKRPPYFFFILWLYGASRFFERLEVGVATGQTFNITNWVGAWFMAAIAGFIIGFIGYYVLGSIYHLFVRLAGGVKDWNASRNIFLYSYMPMILVSILSVLSEMIVYGNRFFDGITSFGWNMVWLVLTLVALIYSLVLSYKGVVLIQKTGKIKSVIIFIVLPILLYASVFTYSYYRSNLP
jgi:hypothetical protein